MDLSLEPSEIAQDLICNGLKEIDYRNSDIAKGQETAVRMSLEQPITFVWGPPGTGLNEVFDKEQIDSCIHFAARANVFLCCPTATFPLMVQFFV